MTASPVLGQLTLGHSPLIDRRFAVVATRVTVLPLQRDGAPDAQGLIDALLSVWPASDKAAAPPASAEPTAATPVLLNLASEPWLRAMLQTTPPPHLMIEVPAFMAADPELVPVLQGLHQRGSVLVMKGRPARELPREVLPAFRHSLIDHDDDRRGDGSAAPEGVQRRITHIQTGVRTRADVRGAFGRGAVGVIGWPIEEEPDPAQQKAGGTDLQVVMELIRRVDAGEPIERLEAVIKNDPQLGFRLIRYMNSAAFGLSAEITSFRHALMMLGYKKLKRWLALLLASASQDPTLGPAMHAAVRRGTLMEELGRSGMDDEARSEMFICGVFSLLDLMLGQPMDQLLQELPVSDRVRSALVEASGPFQPYLQLVRAVESGARGDIQSAADLTFLGQAEVNSALLRALATARAFA